MKKLLSLVLAIAIIICAVPLGAFEFRASAATVTSGTTGDCTWSLNGTVLTISGNGEMADYDPLYNDYAAPWGTDITKVIIEFGVTNIGDYAFYGCDSLVSVTISNSVTSIGDWAFSNCNSLTNITIPDSVTSIGDCAFDGCGSLTSVIIPDSVTSIGISAFISCSITSVYITDIAAWCNIDFENSASNPLYYDGNLYLNGELLTDLVIPDGVTSIGKYAFYRCAGLTSVTIPDSVTGIGEDAFLHNNHKQVYITDIAAWCNIEFETYGSNPLCNNSSLYLNGELLTDLVIPNGVTSIGRYAFYFCDGLTSVTIPDSVTSIGEDAFWGFWDLQNVYITDVAAWCNIDFEGYDSNPLYRAGNLYLNGELITELIIPESVTSIGDCTFCGYYSLTSITIHDNVTSIGDFAFYGCGITRITIPDSVISIGNYAFDGCSGLTSVTISNSVTSIGEGTFCACDNLTRVTIPYGVTSIGDWAFSNCNSLTNITIPDSVTSIGDYAFYYCNSFTDVWYTGSETDKTKIVIGTNNSQLTDATWHYNICKNDEHTYIDDCTNGCSKCDWKTDEHIYDNNCDADCNECGTTRTIMHTYDDACDKTCNVCGNTRAELTHAYDDSCDTICNECGAVREITHTYSNDCDAECNICGETRIPSAHKYDNACDKTCNACGTTRTVPPHVYTNYCDTTCNECGAVRSIIHTYSNNCDADCNICGATRTPSDHVYDHIYDAECNVCGAVREATPLEWEISVTKTGVYSLKPNSKYTGSFSIDKIAVYDKNGNEVKYNESKQGFSLVKDQKYTVKFRYDCSDEISGTVTWTKTKKSDTIFSDASASEWYNDAITYSVGRGLISGYGGTNNFGPADNIQRQDFLVILARLDGVDLTQYANKKCKFPDVPKGSYYEAAVIWGYENKIVTGYQNGKFGVGDKITREQLVTFLYRYANYKGVDVSYTDSTKNTVSKTYTDYKKVSDWSQDCVLWAIEKGVIKGKTSTTIVPGGNALRCEVAQIMYNIFLKDIF